MHTIQFVVSHSVQGLVNMTKSNNPPKLDVGDGLGVHLDYHTQIGKVIFFRNFFLNNRLCIHCIVNVCTMYTFFLFIFLYLEIAIFLLEFVYSYKTYK